jgi:AcrR family transcriptional regulator
MVDRVPYLSESPGGVAYLVGDEKSFCRGRSVSGQVTRIRILRVGLDLASAEGLCRITFGSVARHANLSKGGVVSHFPHLGDLKRSILDVALDLWSRTCLGVNTGVGDGLPSLIRYLNVWIGWTRRAGLPGSCPIAQAIVELSFLPGPVREAAAAAESVWRQALIMLIRDAIDKRHFLPDTDVAQLAWDFFGIYLSHHVSSHSLRDPDADRKAQFSVKRIVASIEAINEGATHQRQGGQ